jgi:hypothetical protein
MGMALKLPLDRLVDSAMSKYNVPEWVRPYAYKYVRNNPIGSVKFAISLVDTKRKKGEVTKERVMLPNGKSFKVESILKVLSLFFYGEDVIAHIERGWADVSRVKNAEYERRFSEMSELDAKYARAIKNLAEGLGGRVGERQESLARTFDYIAAMEDWNERVFVTGLVLRYAYARTFGSVFYKVFYPVAPEFMRSFGKAFSSKNRGVNWDTEEAERLVRSGTIERGRVLELARETLARIMWSVDANMRLAKELSMEKEVALLSEVSVAYPFHRLEELGVELDVKDEIETVRARFSKLKSGR